MSKLKHGNKMCEKYRINFVKIAVIIEYNTLYSYCLLPVVTLYQQALLSVLQKPRSHHLNHFAYLYRLCLSVMVTKYITSLGEQVKEIKEIIDQPDETKIGWYRQILKLWIAKVKCFLTKLWLQHQKVNQNHFKLRNPQLIIVRQLF